MLKITATILLGMCIATGALADDQSLFDEIGGAKILHATVDEFVDIMLNDDRINFAFAQSNLNIFKQRLYSQLCALASGPCRYEGRDMKTAHEKLAVNNAQFNALAEDLYRAFDRVGVKYHTQNKMMALLAPMQKDVVKKSATQK
jgi:hemoglobin